jgi:glutamine amidotransferase PdxT
MKKMLFTLTSVVGLSAFGANDMHQRLEVEVDKNCKEDKIIAVFKSSPKVDFVRSEFEMMGKKEIKLVLAQDKTLSNDEIKSLARSANCQVLFVERD